MSSKTTNRPRSAQGSNAGENIKTDKTAVPSAWSNPTPNAWSRPLKTRPPPGLAPPPALTAQNGVAAINPVLRERFLHLTLSLVGQRVTLIHTDGTVLEGVFHTATPFSDMPSDKKNRFVLKAVNVIKGDSAKVQHGSTVVVPADRIVSLHCKSLRLGSSNGKGEAFRTDSEISTTLTDKGRDLVAAGSAWTSGATTGKVSRADSLLGDGPRKPSAGLRGNIGEWDQFRANEELFNVQAKFDENLYTTELDKSSIDSAKIKEAERLAREIEKTVSTNIHIAEERNQAIQGDYDEEDRYSGVLTEKLQVRNKDPVPPKQAMNYAAAAAKADTAKAGPPGFTAGKKGDIKIKKVGTLKEETKVASPEESKPEATNPEMTEDTPNENEKNITQTVLSRPSVEEEKTEPPVVNNETEQIQADAVKEKSEQTSTATSESADDSSKKATAKLNANGKSFTFNPAAKAFTPSFGVPAPAVAPQGLIPQQMMDPNIGAPIPPHIPGQQHYMHQMGHPAMMHMMNPPFAHMRYPGGYPGMEQPLPPGQMHPHPQHMQPQTQDGQQQATPGGEEQQQPVEQSANGAQHPLDPHPPHPGLPVPYPPNASPYHYGVGMPMQRGPGGPQMGGYHPQMVGGPQQIQVVPGNPYRHMYGMPQPPPQMRGPSGAPYYPNVPPHYPHYMGGEGDDYRGGGRGGRGAGRGRRGGRKGGRVGPGRGYQSWSTNPRDVGMLNGGRNTPQDNLADDPTPAEQQSVNAEERPATE